MAISHEIFCLLATEGQKGHTADAWIFGLMSFTPTATAYNKLQKSIKINERNRLPGPFEAKTEQGKTSQQVNRVN